MEKTSDWASPTVMEAPYWKNEMTVEEYEHERSYYYSHIEDVKKGIYKPLWAQNTWMTCQKMVHRSAESNIKWNRGKKYVLEQTEKYKVHDEQVLETQKLLEQYRKDLERYYENNR